MGRVKARRKKAQVAVTVSPRILSVGAARPPYLWQQDTLTRIAKENLLGPDWEDDTTRAEDARRIYKIGEHYNSVDETLARIGYAPNRRPAERGIPRHKFG